METKNATPCFSILLFLFRNKRFALSRSLNVPVALFENRSGLSKSEKGKISILKSRLERDPPLTAFRAPVGRTVRPDGRTNRRFSD